MGLPTEENLKLWRYISFARFVWLLQNKKLWLSRADLLGDPWEISLAGNQLDPVIARHPITPLGQTVPQENAIDRSKRIIKLWREKTFVSCWSASDHENHALWRIYCQTSEGVAIQTTQAQMKISIGELPLYKVTYEQPGDARRTPTIQDLLKKNGRCSHTSKRCGLCGLLMSEPTKKSSDTHWTGTRKNTRMRSRCIRRPIHPSWKRLSQ